VGDHLGSRDDDPDRDDGEGSRVAGQRDHRYDCADDGKGAGAEAGPASHRFNIFAPTESGPVEDRDHHDYRDDGGCPRAGHVRRERGAGRVGLLQHDEVGEIGTGQEQRPGIGHAHHQVEERFGIPVLAPRRRQHHRREEGDRGVEVERDRDHRDQPGRAQQK
jgi:hypothetical protein